jgi:hypothetical protein
MPVADVKKYPRNRGRAHRATPLPASFRFTPANDNRAPKRLLAVRILLAVTGLAALAVLLRAIGRL